ncbi:DinB superfamily protein [Chitinophaga rupis]|uniref:DinB superfamily protein n=1 Tax=Chitinophaga rupis TaxID=573321 RepID=A0A1H7R3D3_9BACT|nr:DinB family protein [Chitinophaga rupis]SEL54731.1 DinB superfamily protein [Chitinophaga rupis]
MKRTNWFDRKFSPIEDNGILPCIIERLEGTPARLAEKMKQVNQTILSVSKDHKWSIKREIGHLLDLEPLWLERAKEIIAGEPDLKKADLTNRKTQEADHDEKDLTALITDFGTQRQYLVQLLRGLQDADLDKSAKHPRLGTPMRIIDLAYFVAEHDDHHLAQITFLQNSIL